MIFSTGTLRYSPKLLGNSSSKWWLVLDCDQIIVRYYYRLYHMYHHHCRSLQIPSWDSHISVVRDEEPADFYKPLWGIHTGERVEFTYTTNVRDDGVYFWLDVECKRLLDIREELGLPRNPEYSLHLSIGHI